MPPDCAYPPIHGDDRRQHSRHEFLVAILASKGICRTHNQGFSGAFYVCACENLLADRWRQQVDLKFDTQNIASLRRDAESCVTARRVQDAGDRARVHKVILLRERQMKWETNLHFTRLTDGDLRPQRGHESLPAKTFTHAALKRFHDALQ